MARRGKPARWVLGASMAGAVVVLGCTNDYGDLRFRPAVVPSDAAADASPGDAGEADAGSR